MTAYIPAAHVHRWDRRAIELAKFIASWSKDPSTKVGAVIMRNDNTIASVGFNGFPRRINDDGRLDNREEKYEIIVHAELNAVLTAREPLHHYTMAIWPMMSCSRCASAIIQSGIRRVIAPHILPEFERWRPSIERSLGMFTEAGLAAELLEIDL